MATESYLVQLLSDSNLPTGGFIASGGLESYHAHGFLPPRDTVSTTLSFVEHTLANYAASVLPYMCAAYRLSRSYIDGHDDALDALCRLDWHHHTLLLNHVSRRASLIQGIALLTLYVRSFSSALQEDSARADAWLRSSGGASGVAARGWQAALSRSHRTSLQAIWPCAQASFRAVWACRSSA